VNIMLKEEHASVSVVRLTVRCKVMKLYVSLCTSYLPWGNDISISTYRYILDLSSLSRLTLWKFCIS